MLLHSLVAFVKRVFARVRPQRRPLRRRMQNFEMLEGRGLLSAVSLGGAVYAHIDLEANNTLDTAQDVGSLNAQDIAAINGLIGEGTGLSTDADWYSFTLSESATVQLDVAAHSADEAAAAVVSLYGGESELWEAHNPLRRELLEQVSSEETDSFEVTLGAGTYFVAVTGGSNRYFHPFLADSGLPGVASEYELHLAVAPLTSATTAGAQVLGSNIDADSELTSAPSVITVRFDRSLDESLIADGDTVQLFSSQFTTTEDGEVTLTDEQLLSVGYWSFSHNLNELTLIPTTALKAGHYRLVLSNRLLAPGEEAAAADFELSFDVVGQEGCAVSDCGDDTITTATDLGDVLTTVPLQVTGVIGDDPAYDPYSEDIALWNRASDVDLYRFTVTGEGQWSFVAEAFAGRFGSPLDPSLTLLQRMPDGSLELVHFNGNTQNPAEANNGTLPLFTDNVLYAGLTEGEYFLAVSSATNDPEYGPDGVFNPSVTHSGLNGAYTGDYVINLSLTSDNVAPSVTATSIEDGATLTDLPRRFTVSFSEMVNLQQTAAEAYLRPDDEAVRSVFITNDDGTVIYPRFDSYDSETQTATFLLLDGLPNGAHELHLPAGTALTDLAGNPVAANDASGDYVIRFNVAAPERGVEGDAQVRHLAAGHESFEDAQDLDMLFPRELEGVVCVRRTSDVAATATDTDTYIRFEILQTQFYFIALRSDDVTAVTPTTFELLNSDGSVTPFASSETLAGQGVLHAGQYVLHVGGWTAEQASSLTFHIDLALAGNSENPTPLTSGAASAIGLRLNQASIGGSAVTATTFVRPIVSAPRFAGASAISGAAAASSSVTSVTPGAAPAGTSSTIAALPRGLNAGFVARPLGADSFQEVEQRTGPSDTLLVKLWDKPETQKLFALLDEELPTAKQTRTDVIPMDAELENDAPTDSTEDRGAADKTEPAATSNEQAGVQLEERAEPTPTALDRILQQVNESLTVPSTQATPASKPVSSKVAPQSEPQASRDAEIRNADSPLLAGLHAPIGAALALATAASLRGDKKHRKPVTSL